MFKNSLEYFAVCEKAKNVENDINMKVSLFNLVIILSKYATINNIKTYFAISYCVKIFNFMSLIKRQIPNFINPFKFTLRECCCCTCSARRFRSCDSVCWLWYFFCIFSYGLAARALDVKSDLGFTIRFLSRYGHKWFGSRNCNVSAFIKSMDSSMDLDFLSSEVNWMIFIGLIITLGSAYRLAKFNIDERQTESFIGLPTPANALLILS